MMEALEPPARPATRGRTPQDATAAARRRSSRQPSPGEFIPKRRDSSIGATSTNPRVRSGSLMDIAARNPRLQQPTPVDFSSPESQDAMARLRRAFLPIVLKDVLRRRRRAGWQGGVYPPRTYTTESVVSALTASNTVLAQWPASMLTRLAQEAAFHYLRPGETIVYLHESHLSSGVVVLLHGQLTEDRRKPRPMPRPSDSDLKHSASGDAEDGLQSSLPRSPARAERPVSTQRTRTRRAPDTMCVMPVLCEDRSLTSLSCRPANESADVAVIPSRWLWQVFHEFVLESPQVDAVLASFRQTVIPQRVEMLLGSYFATSVVLQRSWMWPSLSGSDRVKLARTMSVQVLGMGDVLHAEGQYDPYMYIVRRGTLTVVVKEEPLSIVEAGTAFGEESLLFNDPRNSAVVSGSVCELYRLHVSEVKKRVDRHPELLEPLVKTALSRRRQWLEGGRVRDLFGLVSLLGGVPCLSHTTDAMREEIALTARCVTVPAGVKLAVRDSLCDTLFVVGRGSVRVGGLLDPNKSFTALTHAGEVRSAGDFFGELCLRKHYWPTDVVSETSVDLWLLSTADMLKILVTTRADVQAEEVCRQGITLYRARHGDESLREEFNEPGGSLSASRRASGSQRSPTRPPLQESVTMPRRRSGSGRSATFPLPALDLVVAYGDFDWTDYCRAKLAQGVLEAEERAAAAGDSSNSRSQRKETQRDILPTDREVEKAMNRKVIEYISVPPDHEPCVADADFPGEVNELQAIIVEQLLLIPSEEQPKFLRQIAKSNVKLVAAEGDDMGGAGGRDTFTPGNPNFESMADLDWTLGAAPLATELGGHDDFFAGSSTVRLQPLPLLSPNGILEGPEGAAVVEENGTIPLHGSQHGSEAGANSSVRPFGATTNDLISLESSLVARSRRSNAGLDDSSVFGVSPNAQQRNSMNRSHLVRPLSGLPVSPRSGNAPNALISPRAALGRPPSSSEPRFSLFGSLAALGTSLAGLGTSIAGGAPSPNRARPNSVDYGMQSKINADRSTTMLDRYVKIEDQDYFNAFVQVLPLQQDELWLPDDMSGENGFAPDSLILLLVHVRKCDNLATEMMEKCAQPMVKVSTGSKVLLRSPFPTETESGLRAPKWPMERTSFITFVRRGVDVDFAVCDGAGGADEAVYAASLNTSDINENGGVGQRRISLRACGDMPVTEATLRPQGNTYMSITLMAVTASRYKVLHQHLRATQTDDDVDGPDHARSRRREPEEFNTCHLQLVGVEGLAHRIEGAITVTQETDGEIVKLLETPRVMPKTRAPCWPASVAAVKVSGDGYLTFRVSHRDAVIGACETTADELVFGGPGLRRLPVLLLNVPGEVIGHIIARVLATETPNTRASGSADSLIALYTEQFTMAARAEAGTTVVPDPFICLKNANGQVLLRTPMAIGKAVATWAPEDATCFLPCPVLKGSEVGYRLEVMDNEAVAEGGDHPPIGLAALSVSQDGLGRRKRYDVPLDGGRGTVRVTALRLPVVRPFSSGGGYPAAAAASPSSPAAAQQKKTSGAGSGDDDDDDDEQDVMVMLHVRGCRGLHWAGEPAPQDGDEPLEQHLCVDAIVTARVEMGGAGAASASGVGSSNGEAGGRGPHPVDRELLRTTISSSTTSCPRWSIQDESAVVVLRIGAAERRSRVLEDAVVVFDVYDGLVDEVDRLGGAQVPLARLLCSSSHRFTLYAPAVAASSASGDGSGGGGGGDDGYEKVGAVEVRSLCGRMNEQVWPVGSTVNGLPSTPSEATPMARASTMAGSGSGAAPASVLRLRLTGANQLLHTSDGTARKKAQSGSQDTFVVVSAMVAAGKRVLLRYEPDPASVLQVGESSIVFKEAVDATVDLRALRETEGKVMDPSAMAVRIELVGELVRKGAGPSPAAAEGGEAAVSRAEKHRRTFTCQVPYSALAAISAGEVAVQSHLLTEKADRHDSHTSASSRPPAGDSSRRHSKHPEDVVAVGHGPGKKPLAPEMCKPSISLMLVGEGPSGTCSQRTTLNVGR